MVKRILRRRGQISGLILMGARDGTKTAGAILPNKNGVKIYSAFNGNLRILPSSFLDSRSAEVFVTDKSFIMRRTALLRFIIVVAFGGGN
jgi:hypothetical protein